MVIKPWWLDSSSPVLTLSGSCPLPTESLKRPLITEADSKGPETHKSFSLEQFKEPLGSTALSMAPGGAQQGGLWPSDSLLLFSSTSAPLHPPLVTELTYPCTQMKTSRHGGV